MADYQDQVLSPHNTVVSTQHPLPTDQDCCVDTESVAYTPSLLSPHNTPPLEPSHSKDCDPDQIDQIRSTSKISQIDHPPTRSNNEQGDEDALIEFICSSLKEKGKGIRNLRAYALKCLKNSRTHWEAEFQKYLSSQSQSEATKRSAAARAVDALQNDRNLSPASFVDLSDTLAFISCELDRVGMSKTEVVSWMHDRDRWPRSVSWESATLPQLEQLLWELRRA